MKEGLNAIKFLSKSINSKEKVSSSHWNYYHKDFNYEKETLSGLMGFGALTTPYKGLFRNIHYNFEFDDQILENELCPWHQYFYMKYPPFFKKYDGPTRHQLRLIQNK